MKNILSIFIFLALTNITVFGQDEIRKKQFLIGGFASPGISNYRSIMDINDNYVPGFSYNIGAEALFQIKSKFSMSIGLQYGFKKPKTEEIDLCGCYYAGPPIGGYATKVTFHYNQNYLDIPIRVDFYLSKRKIAPIITTGISTNLFIKEKVSYTSTYADGHKEEGYYYYDYFDKTYQRIHLELQLGMGVDIALSKARLRIFPIYKRSGYFNSFQLGINYLFKV